MATDNSYVNALVGAVVTVVFSFAGVSPLLGGAAAGYLERRDGARVGAIAGAIALVPMLGLLALASFYLGFVGLSVPFAALGVLAIAALFVAAYVLALSTVGGIVGVYLAEEFRE